MYSLIIKRESSILKIQDRDSISRLSHQIESFFRLTFLTFSTFFDRLNWVKRSWIKLWIRNDIDRKIENKTKLLKDIDRG